MNDDRPGEDRAPVNKLDANGLLSALTTHDVAFVVIGGLSLAGHRI